MDARVTKISLTELPLLRDLFLSDWPKHVIGYYTIDNFIRWFKQDPSYGDAEIYCLDGDWSDGTFVVLVKALIISYRRKVFG